MKKIIILLVALSSISTFAGEIQKLKSFTGSAAQFRKELKNALRSEYTVGCISEKGDNYGILFPDFNSNFRMKVFCKNSHLKVKAIAKLKQVNAFDEITVRSIRVEVEDVIK